MKSRVSVTGGVAFELRRSLYGTYVIESLLPSGVVREHEDTSKARAEAVLEYLQYKALTATDDRARVSRGEDAAAYARRFRFQD